MRAGRVRTEERLVRFERSQDQCSTCLAMQIVMMHDVEKDKDEEDVEV